jgi:hypothetical protein
MRAILYEWVEKSRKELYVFKLTGEMFTGEMFDWIEGSGPFDG